MSASSAVPEPATVGPLTRTDFVRYAGAGGDFNPVHHDDEYARGLGFPSVFAMGMLPAGILGGYVSRWLGPRGIGYFGVRFTQPTWPGDALDLTAADLDADGQASLSATADGDSRITGSVVRAAGHSPARSESGKKSTDRLATILSTKLDDVVLPVERGKVIEFSRAVHAPQIHVDLEMARAAGYADLPAPPTFTACVAHWSGGDATAVPIAAGLDIRRVLHGEQRYWFTQPVVAGQMLQGKREVSAAWTKESRSGGQMTFVVVTTEFVESDGTPILVEEMVMVERPE
ncbi:MAG: MaoC family dehydratase N-terminal domain-containing protein [Pseudolysinimonas sp.]